MPLEPGDGVTPEHPPFIDDSFVSAFRNSLRQAQQFLSQGTASTEGTYPTELPHDAWEYKPELAVSQQHQDIVLKFRFDKLGASANKKRKLSPPPYDGVASVPPPFPERKEKSPILDGVEKRYGPNWLQR